MYIITQVSLYIITQVSLYIINQCGGGHVARVVINGGVQTYHGCEMDSGQSVM
jgi:formylmethanofuran dehydrogenase subunit C